MKATEQFFPVVLFIILYKVFLTFESLDEILKCACRTFPEIAIDPCFLVMKFIMLYRVLQVLRLWTKFLRVTTQTKLLNTDQYTSLVSFLILEELLLSFAF